MCAFSQAHENHHPEPKVSIQIHVEYANRRTTVSASHENLNCAALALDCVYECSSDGGESCIESNAICLVAVR